MVKSFFRNPKVVRNDVRGRKQNCRTRTKPRRPILRPQDQKASSIATSVQEEPQEMAGRIYKRETMAGLSTGIFDLRGEQFGRCGKLW